jgi:hypothetical protein
MALPRREPRIAKRGPDSVPLEEQIRRRAHQIYLQRGGDGGSELDDWLEAESEIRAEKEDRLLKYPRLA